MQWKVSLRAQHPVGESAETPAYPPGPITDTYVLHDDAIERRIQLDGPTAENCGQLARVVKLSVRPVEVPIGFVATMR